MINLFRRHTRSCTAKRRQHDRAWRKCNCVIHAAGTLGQEKVRESLKIRKWDRAAKRVLEAEARGWWRSPTGTAKRTVPEAIQAFFEDASSAKGRALKPVTLSKYRTLLARLETFCRKRALVYLADLKPEHIRDFRNSWPTGVRASANNLARLRALFRFAIENEWLTKNPATLVRLPKAAKADSDQKQPFTAEQMERIITAAYSDPEAQTLIHLMRHSGLRISDAVMLRTGELEGDTLRVLTRKAKRLAVVPIPAFLVERLAAMTPKNGDYYFAAGSLRMETQTDAWRKRISVILEAADVKGTPHMFRHTFACEKLLAGVDIKSLSMLLAHSSVLITERFYAAFVPTREKQLSDLVRKSWTL